MVKYFNGHVHADDKIVFQRLRRRPYISFRRHIGCRHVQHIGRGHYRHRIRPGAHAEFAIRQDGGRGLQFRRIDITQERGTATGLYSQWQHDDHVQWRHRIIRYQQSDRVGPISYTLPSGGRNHLRQANSVHRGANGGHRLPQRGHVDGPIDDRQRERHVPSRATSSTTPIPSTTPTSTDALGLIATGRYLGRYERAQQLDN